MRKYTSFNVETEKVNGSYQSSFVHALNHQLDLQSAGSSPNLTYTKISVRDAIRIL